MIDAGSRPGSRATFVSAKVAKTMLAVLWPFGFPTRFANTGGAQTRCAQTVRTFSPVLATLLGHTTRPARTAEAMRLLIIMEGQLATLRQGPQENMSVHSESRTAGVGHTEEQGLLGMWDKSTASIFSKVGCTAYESPRSITRIVKRWAERKNWRSQKSENTLTCNTSLRRTVTFFAVFTKLGLL